MASIRSRIGANMEDRYLFKGKRVDNGKWVIGNLVYSVYKKDDICIGQYGNEIGMHTVIPETICQCTGLKDKHGNLIWENDIGRYQWDGKTKTDVIVYDGSMFTYSGSMRWDLCQDEMIGNIFDNPELLERKE